MSKLLAAFYGHKSINRQPLPQPQEYTVLGINQPLVAPKAESAALPAVQPHSSLPKRGDGQRKFRVSLLLNKLM
jgi:hypothetical protein